MPRNDDGEFELILGNKQLLSVFFIVVTLLAVFFAMGFIMGRSVNPVAEARKVDNAPSDKPIIVDAKPSAGSGITASTRPVEIKSPIETEVKTPETKLPEPKVDVKTKAELVKEAEAKKAEERAAEKKTEREKAEREKEAKAEAKKTEREKAEREKEAKREKKTEAKREPVAAGGRPEPGGYLQVAAVGKSEADLVVEVLAKRGFKAYAVPVEGKELFRVVVGPVKPGAEQSRTMDDLRTAGFKPFPRKL